MTGNAPLVPLAGLYENTSQKSGRRYFVGYLGKAKLLMLEVPEADREEGKPTWTLFVQEKQATATATTGTTLRPRQQAPSGGGQRTRTREPSSGRTHARPFNDPIGL